MQVSRERGEKTLCVIGDPVAHSKSPLIHGAMIAALGLDYVYLGQRVEKGGLPAFLAEAKKAGYAGFNATMPHKEDLVPLMDVLDEAAAQCGSVNTVCIRDGRLYGYSTDGRGFLRALEDRGFSPEGKRAVLLGAGGAAKAVALALVAQGVTALTVCNRTAEKVEALCAHSAVMHPAGFDGESLCRVAGEADLLVNCTSLGMGGTGGQFEDLSFLGTLPPHATVCDLIYHPARTDLLSAAAARGLTALNGLGMLIHQAIFALEHFSGQPLDGDRLRVVVERALKEGACL